MVHFLTGLEELMWRILNITFNNVRLEWLNSAFYSVRVKAALG